MTRKLIAVAITIYLAIPVLVFAADEGGNLNIKEYLEQSLPAQDGRKITYNGGTKLLTVTDTKSNQEVIKNLIKEFEVGPRQVMIETRFVEIAVNDTDELGIEWDFFHPGNANGNNSGFTIGAPLGTPYQGVRWNNDITSTFPVVGNFAGQLAIGKLLANGENYVANLRFLEQQGKANLLSAPKVTTISGQMANIQVVRTYPYVSDFTLENIGTAEFPIWSYKLTLAEKPIGIFLEATPYVTEGSNTITLDLHPEVSVLRKQVAISNLQSNGETGQLGNVKSTSSVKLIPPSLGWPVVDVRTSQTSVSVDSGATIVLGGLFKDSETVTKKKIPVLGDIPLLGQAFQYDYKNQTKTNLLIFITASIIDAKGEVIR
jgi:type II secretory pathway component GspD/PulD (secretin)